MSCLEILQYSLLSTLSYNPQMFSAFGSSGQVAQQRYKSMPSTSDDGLLVLSTRPTNILDFFLLSENILTNHKPNWKTSLWYESIGYVNIYLGPQTYDGLLVLSTWPTNILEFFFFFFCVKTENILTNHKLNWKTSPGLKVLVM